jgi:hypothetical protein
MKNGEKITKTKLQKAKKGKKKLFIRTGDF